MDKDYNIIAFDAQYILHRNFAALKGRTGIETADKLDNSEGDSSIGYIVTKYNFDYQTLVKHFYWSIVKIVRDHFSCNKVILLWDIPPYHKLKWIPEFKGDRVHYNQRLLDEWDIKEDPQGYLQAKEDVRMEGIKNEAKWFIINNLGSLGMPSLGSYGYEADDMAYMLSQILHEIDKDNKSAICSVDSDWMYWTSPNVDWIKHTTLQVWTYQDGLDDCEGVCEKYGMTLFELKQFMDSTFLSHNGLERSTELTWRNIDQLITEYKLNDYSNIEKDKFLNNMKSFEIWNYPEYEVTKNSIRQVITEPVNFDMDTFSKLRTRGFSVSQSYVENYKSCLIETVEEGSEP